LLSVTRLCRVTRGPASGKRNRGRDALAPKGEVERARHAVPLREAGGGFKPRPFLVRALRRNLAPPHASLAGAHGVRPHRFKGRFRAHAVCPYRGRARLWLERTSLAPFGAKGR
jgi:hypothetical protein